MADTTDTPTPETKKEKKPTSYDILVPTQINLTDQAALKALAEKHGTTFTVLVQAGTAEGLNPKQALAAYANGAEGDVSGDFAVVASASVNSFKDVGFQTTTKLVIK